MSIVWTNWKLVWQWRKGLLWVAALMLIFMVALGVCDGFLFFLFILAFLVRPCCAVHSYVGARSFSFCLPGYRGVLRKMILTDAMFGGVAFGMFRALLLGDWIWPLVGLNAVTGFCVGFALFLLMGPLDPRLFVLAPAAGFSLIIFGVGVLMTLGTIAIDVWLIWPVLILLSVAVSAFVWIRLYDARDVAHAHRAMVVDRLRRQLGQMGDARVSAPWVDELFLGCMTRPDSLRAGRWFWGGLYRAFGLALSAWKWLLILIVGSTVLLGYASAMSQWQALVALGLVAWHVKLPILSDLLLPEGRREKQRSVIGAAAATVLLLVGVASLVVGLSWSLAPIMPRVLGRAYVGMNPGNIYLASVVVPWILLFQPIRYGVHSVVWKNVLRVVAVFMIVIAFSDPQVSRWLGLARPAFFAIIFVLGWVLFLPLLRHVYRRGHLTT